ncbi:MAG: HAD-IA family hydrolase [Pseudomonadota bacterium]
MTPKAVVFDIGNVLMTWDPVRLYRKVTTAEELAALKAEVDLDAMNLEVDRGAPFRETVEATAARHPAYAALIRLWHTRWPEMFGPPIAGSWQILERLQARQIPVFALTNFGRETFQLARGLYPELNRFDQAFVSGELGLLKPAPEIYARLERETGLTGPDLFFTDDRRDNIEAARRLGWQGHVFGGSDGLQAALSRVGLG